MRTRWRGRWWGSAWRGSRHAESCRRVCGSTGCAGGSWIVCAASPSGGARRGRCARRDGVCGRFAGGVCGVPTWTCSSGAVCAEARNVGAAPMRTVEPGKWRYFTRRSEGPRFGRMPCSGTINRKSAGDLDGYGGPRWSCANAAGAAARSMWNAARKRWKQANLFGVPLGFPVLARRFVGDSRTGALGLARRGSPKLSS